MNYVLEQVLLYQYEAAQNILENVVLDWTPINFSSSLSLPVNLTIKKSTESEYSSFKPQNAPGLKGFHRHSICVTYQWVDLLQHPCLALSQPHCLSILGVKFSSFQGRSLHLETVSAPKLLLTPSPKLYTVACPHGLHSPQAIRPLFNSSFTGQPFQQ